jgi:hypothetical protein
VSPLSFSFLAVGSRSIGSCYIPKPNRYPPIGLCHVASPDSPPVKRVKSRFKI